MRGVERGRRGRTRGSKERERGKGRAKGVIATLREELKRERETGVKEGVCGEQWLI